MLLYLFLELLVLCSPSEYTSECLADTAEHANRAFDDREWLG